MSDPGTIGMYVRNWVHYDNLASSFYKQSIGARKIKDDYENKIIGHLRQTGMENAIIQTSGGGRMSVIEDKKPSPLSLTRIEDLLHAYYRTRGGKDETLDIMQFIKANRGYECKKCLRKSFIPAIPPPSSGNLNQLI